MRNCVKGWVLLLVLVACTPVDAQKNEPYIFVLGTAQDAGYPQIGCEKECCKRVYKNPAFGRMVSCIALIDPETNQRWIFDATPDFSEQVKLLNDHMKLSGKLPDGVFLTHAHIGHYTGLMYLGREAMGANEAAVYAMPKMKSYLESNGPWSQLVTLNNIKIQELNEGKKIVLNDRLSVVPLKVPHRDEFSETVGYLINYGPNKKALFIPDINKWEEWDTSIIELITKVDIALLDASFFKDGEIKGRPMSEIPHPFVQESMALFSALADKDKKKVHFIHFNHTNPLLIDGSNAQQEVRQNGFNLAEQGKSIRF